jgi:hypothetical protein
MVGSRCHAGWSRIGCQVLYPSTTHHQLLLTVSSVDCLRQERLWRQAVVYHLAHAAADPSRPKLRPTATVEKCDTSVLGKVGHGGQQHIHTLKPPLWSPSAAGGLDAFTHAYMLWVLMCVMRALCLCAGQGEQAAVVSRPHHKVRNRGGGCSQCHVKWH